MTPSQSDRWRRRRRSCPSSQGRPTCCSAAARGCRGRAVASARANSAKPRPAARDPSSREVDHIPRPVPRERPRSRSDKARSGGGGDRRDADGQLRDRRSASSRRPAAPRRSRGRRTSAGRRSCRPSSATCRANPFSQRLSAGSFFGPASPSSQSSLDSQLAVQSGPVPSLAVSAPPSADPLGAGQKADAARALQRRRRDRRHPSRWCRPSAGAELAGAADVLVFARPAQRRTSPAPARAARAPRGRRDRRDGEGNLMGTPWRPVGSRAGVGAWRATGEPTPKPERRRHVTYTTIAVKRPLTA